MRLENLLTSKRERDTFWYLQLSTMSFALLSCISGAFMLASPLAFSIALRLSNREYRKFDYNTLFVTILFYILYFCSDIFYLPFAQLDQIAIKYPILKFSAFVFGCFSAIILVLLVVKICFRMVKIGLLQILLAVLLSFISISLLTLIYNGNIHDAFENFWNLILFYQTSMTIVIVSALKGDMGRT